jgi:O-antigen/teichoic acid export membrane protein
MPPQRAEASGVSEDALAPDELRFTTLRGLRWTVIGRPATELIALGSMVVLARLIPPAEFGRFAIAAIVVDLSAIPVAGIGGALVQRASIGREHLQSAFALALVAAAALVGLVLLVSHLVVVPVFGARTAQLVSLSAPLGLILAASTVPSALLQRRLDFRRLSIIDVSNATVRAGVSISMALAGMNGRALVLGALAGGLAASGLTWFWAPPPLPRFRKEATRELAGFGVPTALAAVSWVGFRNCDYAIVGARLGVVPAGLYFRAYTLAVEYQKKVSQVLSSVGFPMLARTRNGAELQQLRGRMVRTLTLLLFPLLVLLAILAPVFVPWCFGKAWSGAAVPTQILAIGGAATLVIDAVGTALMASGRARALLGFGWAHFAVYALAVVLVAPLGLEAVAVSAAAVHTGFLLVGYALLVRGSPDKLLRSLMDDLAPAIVSCAGLAGVAVPASLAMSAAQIGTLPYLAIVVLLGGSAYVLMLRACFPRSLGSLVALLSGILPSWRLRRVARRLMPAGRPA